MYTHENDLRVAIMTNQINAEIKITYADGKPAKMLRGVMVCESTGVLRANTTARPEMGIKAGCNVLVNSIECQRLGLDPVQVMRDQGPIECLLKIGENPGGITASLPDKPRCPVNLSRSTCIECGLPVAWAGCKYCTDCYGEF
jgi:hypothetical protein